MNASLDDHVVRLVHVELDLGTGVGVAEAELRLRRERVRQPLHQLREVHPHAAHQLGHHADVGHLRGGVGRMLECAPN